MTDVCTASIKQFSPVWNLWHNTARVGGALHGVVFAWSAGNVFRTLPLTPDQAAVLRGHASVVVEPVSTAPLGVVETPTGVVEATVRPQQRPMRR